MASGGYPGSYESGKTISGLEQVEEVTGMTVFHAGTRRVEDRFVTAGGRVLGVTALGATLLDAREAAYKGIKKIEFDGRYFRCDIGTI